MSNDLMTLQEVPDLIVIDNSEDFSRFTSDLALWKARLKEVDSDEKAITAPINKSLKEIRAKYKPIKDQCNVSIDRLKSGLNDYRRREDARIAAEQVAIAELAVEGVPIEELTSLVSETSVGGGRLTTVVTANISKLSAEYKEILLSRVWDRAMVEIRKDVALGIIEHGVVVTKEKRS